MTVRLDAGRSVAFDLKDYAHLDHGYAATIHKAQGVTVDRVHVLATPGLDRHAAYVALSRHRERVQLHYGRDDFADDAKLARVLSRERAKDMAGTMSESSLPRRTGPRIAPARRDRPQPARTEQVRRLRRRKRGLEMGGELTVRRRGPSQTPSVPQRAGRTRATAARPLDLCRLQTQHANPCARASRGVGRRGRQCAGQSARCR